MVQLNLDLDDVLMLREEIFKNRTMVNNLKEQERLLVKKIQIVCIHKPEDIRTTLEYVGKNSNSQHIRYCGLCEKKLTIY